MGVDVIDKTVVGRRQGRGGTDTKSLEWRGHLIHWRSGQEAHSELSLKSKILLALKNVQVLATLAECNQLLAPNCGVM